MDTTSHTPLEPGSIHLGRAHVGSQRTYAGRLESLPDSRGLLEATFGEREVPALRIGQHVELRFLDGEQGATRACLAQVVSHREAGGGTSFRFRVKLRSGEATGHRITRRRAERIDVDAATSGSLRIAPWAEGAPEPTPEDELAGATLLDLSQTGARALVLFELESQLFDAERVVVSLHLADSPDGPCRIAARIRWRELGEGGVCYGLEFLLDESPGNLRSQERIASYVHARRAQAGACDGGNESAA